jgi:subtilase family serine protease
MRAIALLCSAFLFFPLTTQAASHTMLPGMVKHPIRVMSRSASPHGYTPSQIRTAYGLGTLSGAGSTVAVVDAFASPNAPKNLETFSRSFGLALPFGLPSTGTCTVSAGPHPCLQVVSSAQKSDAGWGTETDLDVQWAHAIAPQADILLVSTASDSLTSLIGGVRTAKSFHPAAISMSWGGEEFATEPNYAPVFSGAGTAFVASSGDSGAGVSFPASAPGVIGVGGTQLHLNGVSGVASETAWTGSGGGLSEYFSRPTYQRYPTKGGRVVPDVAYDADPSTGFAVYSAGWAEVGGTSAGAPQWAAILASIPVSSRNALPGSLYGAPLQDITSGSNGVCGGICSAKPGFDAVTGLGTPTAALIRKFTGQ